MKVAIYCRESTEKQELDTLVSLCIKEAERLGFKEYKVFKDIESGYTNKREDYLKMLEEIKSDKIKVLILYESSRLTRDELEHQLVYKLLREKKVKVYTVNHGWLNLDDEDDRFLNSLLNLLDAREGRKTAKRVKDRMAELASNGRWTGGPAPFGYDLVDKELVINKEEARQVREIFNLFLEGQATRMKLAKLYGFRDPKRIMRMLKNPVYIGKLKFHQIELLHKKRIVHKEFKVLNGIHEPIISEKVFNLVQQKLGIISRECDTSKYALKDLLYCYCGDKMYRHHRRDKYKGKVVSDKLFYSCKKKNGCRSKEHEEVALVEMVLNELEVAIDSIDFSENVGESNKLQEQLDEYKRLEKQCTIKEEKLTMNLLNGILSQKLYEKFMLDNKENKNFYSSKVKSLKTLIANSSARKSAGKVIKKYFKKIKKEKDPEKINKFLTLIVERIEFVNDFRIYIKLRL